MRAIQRPCLYVCDRRDQRLRSLGRLQVVSYLFLLVIQVFMGDSHSFLLEVIALSFLR
jgi:hypothetical protein